MSSILDASSRSRWSWAAAALAALLFVAPPAHAQTVVTACGTDTATGGTNLATALVTGGAIVIRCGDGATEIRFTQTHPVGPATTIDGESRVTLNGAGLPAMFAFPLTGARQLTLRNLAIQNAPTSATSPITSVVADAPAPGATSVELFDVQVSNTVRAFIVGRLAAHNSTFSGNGDPANASQAVVTATNLELTRVTFSNSTSRPFAGGAVLPAVSRARIVDCVFEGNQRPSLWIGGELSVVRSRFTGNVNLEPTAGDRFGLQSLFIDHALNVAGALELFAGARAAIANSTFTNNRGIWGGAIAALGSVLTVQSSELDGNQATWGGAIAHVSSKDDPSSPVPKMPLSLRHVKLRKNAAEQDGGAVLLIGELTGDAALFSGNTAGRRGGAIATYMEARFAPQLQPPDVRLSRGLFVDNSATAGSGAIEALDGGLTLGNALVSRNTSSAAAAAVSGRVMELANSTIVANQGGGVRIESGGATPPALRLVNTIVAGNIGGNCVGAVGSVRSEGPNLQFPDAVCGAAIAVGDPALRSNFSPGPTSAARGAGAVSVCAGHELVDGRDVYGEERGSAACSIGAVEADLRDDVISRLPAGLTDNPQRAQRFFLLFLLIWILIGIVFGLIYRKRRRAKHGKGGGPFWFWRRRQSDLPTDA
jgi:predicted outer membrane repeat protein